MLPRIPRIPRRLRWTTKRPTIRDLAGIQTTTENRHMTPQAAHQILTNLANGMHPETGAPLPQESVLNHPNVVRALFLACAALQGPAPKSARSDNLPEKAGKAWSAAEDAQLLVEFDNGELIETLAAQHQRTKGAIASRLVRLGRITEKAEVM